MVTRLVESANDDCNPVSVRCRMCKKSTMGNWCCPSTTPTRPKSVRLRKVARTKNRLAVTELTATAITTPHGTCPSGATERACDLVATYCATALNEFVSGSRLFLGHTLRSEVDLNREAGEGVDFRADLTRWIAEHSSNFGVVDVHSSPKDSWGPSVADNFDVVFLQTMPTPQETRVMESVRAKGFRVGVIPGHKVVNDIVFEARQKGAKYAMLLEFNESAPRARLRECCREIATELNRVNV
jgi:hypothetical protein